VADTDSAGQRARWDERHASATEIGAPAEVLLRNAHLLPGAGDAIDLACGRGANALWLAEHSGLTVQAWDFSPVAIETLEGAAAARGLHLVTAVRDVVADSVVQRGRLKGQKLENGCFVSPDLSYDGKRTVAVPLGWEAAPSRVVLAYV
jgi:SAM-dependent methyltransferase